MEQWGGDKMLKDKKLVDVPIKDKIVLWTKPLIEIIDDKVLINDHVIWLKGSYFDVNGEHWVE